MSESFCGKIIYCALARNHCKAVKLLLMLHSVKELVCYLIFADIWSIKVGGICFADCNIDSRKPLLSGWVLLNTHNRILLSV